jgi:hypothetical protein
MSGSPQGQVADQYLHRCRGDSRTLAQQRAGAVRTMVAPDAVTGMLQGARPLTDPCDGFHLGRRSLLHDTDITCTQVCDGLWRATVR